MQGGRKVTQPSTHYLGGGRLDGTCVRHSRRAGVLHGRERSINEGNAAFFMVDANAEFATAGTAHDVSFNLFIVKCVYTFSIKNSEWSHQFKKVRDFDRGIYLRQLGKQAGE